MKPLGYVFLIVFCLHNLPVFAQQPCVILQVQDHHEALPGASVYARGHYFLTDQKGTVTICGLEAGEKIILSAFGYLNDTLLVGHIPADTIMITLQSRLQDIGEVVVSGTLQEVSRTESPVPVEIYHAKFFRKTVNFNLVEAISMINGVRPQINCNVCNTGDIHINGMEGPYTMVTIDGMPIVSGLSTVYGLMGIPTGLIERVEVIKGPASTLYGAEAMAGLVNVITKRPETAPRLFGEFITTSYLETQADLAVKFRAGKASSLLGVNYFLMPLKWDFNKDGFTDVTLQNRISVFNKWSVERKSGKPLTVALRYIYEDRRGGQMEYEDRWRGTDSVYGESVYTHRAEVLGLYQFPGREKFFLQFSWNIHHQDSYYGTMPYIALQQVGFLQTYWTRTVGKKHDLLAGITGRYTWYDDNTTATTNGDSLAPVNAPDRVILPGIFVQDDFRIHEKHRLLAGVRLDYSFVHGPVITPRLNYKFSPVKEHSLRIGGGMGYRVVNLFTEDHAALTGSRTVEIAEKLLPERCVNGYVDYEGRVFIRPGFIDLKAGIFYTYFFNKIVPDYDTDPDKIIYRNLSGDATTRGFHASVEMQLDNGLKWNIAATVNDVFITQVDSSGNRSSQMQVLSPPVSMVISVSYTIPKIGLQVDLTGNVYSPMRLPVQPNDFRPEYSPWHALLNIQFSRKWKSGIEVFAGIKNLFNFIPNDPLMRPFDPFDKYVSDPVNNPNGYTFDTSYNYASMQGIRGFAGLRYTLF